MVTAPLTALLYDRTFLAGSFRAAWQKRQGLYLGLAVTWGWLAWLILIAPHPAHPSSGFGLQQITAIEYALTQPGVILHYLRLSLWPHPLCLDYAWPIARSVGAIVPPVLALALLALVSAWAWRAMRSTVSSVTI